MDQGYFLKEAIRVRNEIDDLNQKITDIEASMDGMPVGSPQWASANASRTILITLHCRAWDRADNLKRFAKVMDLMGSR